MSKVMRLLFAGLAAVVLTASAVWFWARRAPAKVESGAATIEQLQAANLELRARTESLEREAVQLREQLASQGIQLPPRPTPKSGLSPEDASARVEAVRLLAQVQGKLNAAQSSIIELQSRTHELEGTVASLTAVNRKLTGESADLKESLQSTTRIVETMDTEIKTKSERIAQLEAAARKRTEDASASTQKLQTLAAALRDLEDVNRRRENTVATLQRRYRDLTDQFRATAQRLDTQRDNPAPLTQDVSRIQSTVQSAEDDLRQLTTLSAQARSLAQKLTR